MTSTTSSGDAEGEHGRLASPLLTSLEAAAYLRIPLGTLYQLRSKGSGPIAVPVGRYTHYYRADLDAWLHARRGTW